MAGSVLWIVVNDICLLEHVCKYILSLFSFYCCLSMNCFQVHLQILHVTKMFQGRGDEPKMYKLFWPKSFFRGSLDRGSSLKMDFQGKLRHIFGNHAKE